MPATARKQSDFLVVEGDIVLGGAPTVIRLSRSKPVGDTAVTSAFENGALVTVQSDQGRSFNLPQVSGGMYSIDNIPMGGRAEKYRLYIHTQGNGQYASDYVQFKQSPPIDSLSWDESDAGVTVYANTHDENNRAGFYKWNYRETWEYHSPFTSLYIAKVTGYTPLGEKYYVIEPRSSDSLNNICWRSDTSTRIIIQSTKKLSQDIVYKQPLLAIPETSEKIGVTYSVLATQVVLTEEGYNYWTNLARVTENTGTIFDAQPSQLIGNIHSTTNADETVIGFITASTATQQRIFIKNRQLYKWDFPKPAFDICDTVHLTVEGLNGLVLTGIYSIVDQYTEASLHDNYYAAPNSCTDCRVKGGTLQKPSYWP